MNEQANRPISGRMRADIAAALADPAVASLLRAGAPVIVALGEPPRAVHANAEALALFGAAGLPALSARLFGADDSAARRLCELSGALPPGGPARIERLAPGGAPLTLLCRRMAGAEAPLVIAALGLRLSRPRPGLAAPSLACEEPVPPPPAAEASVEPESLSALRARLARNFPGLAPVRFLWRADERNIVVELTPPLVDVVGAGCGALVGRDLLEAAGALGLDPGGLLSDALRARATFSRVDVDWPIDSVPAAAPVTLGGLPVFDRGDDFAGWRGFGVIHLDRLHAAPAVAAPFAPLEAAPEAAAPEVPIPPPDTPAPDEAPPAPEFSGVVVPLRPLNQTVAPPPVAPPVWPAPRSEAENPAASAEDDDSELVTLSPHERSAFREIARALGARAPGTVGAAPSLAAPSFAAPSEAAPSEPAGSEPASPEPMATTVAAADRPEPAPEPESDLSRDRPGAAGTQGESPHDWLDRLPVGVVVRAGGETLHANRVALDWLGYGDLAGFQAAGGLRAANRLAVADLAPGQKRALLLRPATGDSFSADASCETADWRGRPAEIVTLVRPSASALEQRIGVVEASLRQRESEIDEVQSMLDAAADGVVLVNAEGAILGLDRGAETLLDYDRNQVAGENFTLLLARESHAAALEYFARAKIGAERRGRELSGRTRQGAALPLHLAVGRLGKGGGAKFCLILRDLSQWRQTERSMEEARAQAERDSQAKSEFLAKVSHEIRTPLNAILGFAEVIMDERFGPVGNERYKDYLRDIHASGSHVMSLVNDLLDLSKIEAGKLDLSIEAVDANRIVSECVSMMQPQANREKVITRLALAARLPAIRADERSLRQIVLNLLANAVRYNEPGGQVIVSTALSDSGHAVLRIKDTGIGMTESELRTALEPFRQVAPSRGGTGLGLPLTKAMAEANGASFAIRSRKSEGTLVEVVFPLAAEAASVGGAAG
jgi:PAS domain S-box-containing protein